MAPPFSSTFASAAASTNGENAGNRRDNATNEWSRNRVNGAAQTFRRTSATTPSQTQQRESAAPSNTGNEGVYIPPHLNPSNSSRNLPLGDTRYGKEQMLSIYQTLKETSALDRQLDEIFLGGWEPLDKNGAQGQGGRGDGKDAVPGPEVCWNYDADVAPFGLTNMSEEEKQLFSTSVNSPMKLQQNPKETSGPGVIGGRKASVSTYNNTPGASRPGTRRRETSDSFMANGPLSPTENKTFPRTEQNTATPPPALLRRRTDYKEEDPGPSAKEDLDADEGADLQPTFPGLRRAGTGPLSAGLNPPSASPWSAGPQPSAFGSMGSFGSFAIGSATTPTESSEKRPGFGSARGGSRFKDLLSKTSSEDISQSIRDKTSFGALEKLPEEDADNIQSRLRDELRTRPGRSETNPYDEGPIRSGSAALSGAQENLPPSGGIEQMSMSAFGPPGNVGAREFGHDDPYQQLSHGRFNPADPMSPTNTNPYHSPHGRPEEDERDNDPISQAPGLPPFGANRRNMFASSEDRGPPASSTRSGFGSLPGFGGLGGGSGWPSNPLGSNKPPLGPGLGSAFADPIFSPLTDLQSPSASGFGGGFFGSGGFGSAGRASRLGAMFPPAMQEQMRGDSRNEMRQAFESRPESAQQQSIRDAFDNTNRRSEGFGRGSSLFDESPSMRSVEEATNASQAGQFGAPPSGPPPSSLTAPQPAGQRPESYQSGHGLSQSSGSNSDNQLPATQQRQMVMPDRMRWIYRDPQGNTQGPFSGLEMHDWFKAGFFTAELQVKKLEDVEYEPLAQLVRRIGNSREPFLVPQIGVPHGPPSATQGNHWANAPISGVGGSVQPPFASSFPSFGTTLTAEQQNALERRKQEEQFLMARQKEHLAQQQMAMKHMQMQNGMQPLQHQPSAQSLHSQPSFSSMTSPTGYQPAAPGPIQPPQAGMSFGQQGGPTSAGPAFGGGREEDLPNMMDRMTFSQRAGPFSGGPSGPSGPPPEGPSPQQLNSMLQDRARVQQQQQQADMRGHQDAFLGPQGRNDRLDEFHELRGQADLPAGRLGPEEPRPQPIGTQRHVDEQLLQKVHAPIGHPGSIPKQEHEPLSLAQQVQIAAASQLAAAEEHARGKRDTIIEPPPVSISPLPAPAAQRNRLHVADALAAESRSATQTPIETPSVSIAPWAERTTEHPKGPSLREIQEAEAKRAAEQEEIAAATRRAQQAEQEKLSQLLGSTSAPAPAPGLPSTSTWGSPASPVTPGSQSSSVWAKPAATKPGSAASAAAKKTLAQIQKEEESRKQRAAAAAVAAGAQNAAAASPVSAAAVGKRYAELASKVAPATPTTSSAWTTVGSGGKTKAPPAVVATPQPASRTVSTSTVAAAKPRPTLQTSRSTISNQSKANEEFTKWIKGSLGKGLNSNINVDSFVQDLLQLPPEIEIISDSVYASSQTLDGRRFAEEFVRRRRLADKGIIEPATNGAGGMDGKGAGGWSEVAKKGPAVAPKEENNASFKVVATKKKGKR
ncbi:kinesin-like protein [Exophiala sideris]|uniref:Kinesin-like protein n=1 Tax=Exophiala sideris TaxID=1016849 RepID=A0ABR0JAI5_9EURO|nr:kinesin-like protein [Exophiala sideris]KAK5038449.1 kinesin-like protein [Exophiala sideris]KAK5060332.1 kinesin-like protein [Exophiala sideris]KAK5183242.1 kinesin-like protein [Eurotiomycetes sp. CCFEE 6388]